MATQVRKNNGDVLIEQMEHCPSSGEIIVVGGKQYTVSGNPRTELIDRGMLGEKWFQVITVTDSVKDGRPGRGAPVRG